ncbi:MAG: ABC transporter permease [Clostridiales bacterium]|nr:ABC transporter permease [Clostridiales bacterium]
MPILKVNSVFQLTKRNVLLFLKNRATVFFSFLAPMLILALYTLFLADTQVGAIRQEMLRAGLDPDCVGLDRIRAIADSWMIAGVISISTLTIGLNSMLVMISDKETKTINDFISSPIKPHKFFLAYFIAAFLLTFTLCILVLIVGLFYLTFVSGVALGAAEIFELLLILLLSCMSSVMIMACIMGFFKSNASVSGFNGIFSAIIGFVIGAYFPLGMLPAAVQTVSGTVPATHATALFRNVLMDAAMGGADGLAELTAVIPKIRELYAISLNLFGFTVNKPVMYVYLSLSILLAFLMYLLIDRLRKKLTK